MKKIVFSLFLGSLSLLTVTAQARSGVKRQVKGTLQYEDYTYLQADVLTYVDLRPIAFVAVTLKTTLFGLPWALGTVTTDSNGYFSKWIDNALLLPGAKIQGEFIAENYACTVYLSYDPNGVAFRSSSVVPLQWCYDKTISAGDSAIDFSATVTKSEFSQHFNIVSTVLYGRIYADGKCAGTDDIRKVIVEYPSDKTHYDEFGEQLYLGGPPSPWGYGVSGGEDFAFGDWVILHEYAHHLQFDICYDSTDEAPDPQFHNILDTTSYDFCWLEGFADYFAEAVCAQVPTKVEYCYSSDAVPPFTDAMTNIYPTAPPSSEAMTEAILWDVHDAAGGSTPYESHDLIDGAKAYAGKSAQEIIFAIFDLEMDHGVQANIFGFHNAFVDRNLYRGSHADLDRIFFAHGVYPHEAPDFAITSITPSSSQVTAGKSVTLSISGTHTGENYPDDALRGRIYMGNTTTGTVELGTFTFDPFPTSHTSRVFTKTVTLPNTVPAGGYFIYVFWDPEDHFPEATESNNLRMAFIEVVAPLLLVAPSNDPWR